jgi:uncharacterized OB-fold protein
MGMRMEAARVKIGKRVKAKSRKLKAESREKGERRKVKGERRLKKILIIKG